MMGVARNRRSRLFESIRSNREKIGRAMDRLRDAMVRERPCICRGGNEIPSFLSAFLLNKPTLTSIVGSRYEPTESRL